MSFVQRIQEIRQEIRQQQVESATQEAIDFLERELGYELDVTERASVAQMTQEHFNEREQESDIVWNLITNNQEQIINDH